MVTFFLLTHLTIASPRKMSGWDFPRRQTETTGKTPILLTTTRYSQVTNLFKYGFQRLRPCYEPSLQGLVRLVKTNCGGSFGYFSGHASNSFALAVFFSLILKNRFTKIPLILIGLASAVAYSRIYIGVHYPLDVISGVFFGGLVGFIIYLIWLKITPRKLY